MSTFTESQSHSAVRYIDTGIWGAGRDMLRQVCCTQSVGSPLNPWLLNGQKQSYQGYSSNEWRTWFYLISDIKSGRLNVVEGQYEHRYGRTNHYPLQQTVIDYFPNLYKYLSIWFHLISSIYIFRFSLFEEHCWILWNINSTQVLAFQLCWSFIMFF